MTTVGIPAFAGMTAAWVSAFASSNAFAMHHYQLVRISAAVVLWHEAVGDADALARWCSGPAAELDRLQVQAGQPEFQLEVLGADRPPLQHYEFAVDQLFGTALAPGPAVAQGSGVVEVA